MLITPFAPLIFGTAAVLAILLFFSLSRALTKRNRPRAVSQERRPPRVAPKLGSFWQNSRGAQAGSTAVPSWPKPFQIRRHPSLRSACIRTGLAVQKTIGSQRHPGSPPTSSSRRLAVLRRLSASRS